MRDLTDPFFGGIGLNRGKGGGGGGGGDSVLMLPITSSGKAEAKPRWKCPPLAKFGGLMYDLVRLYNCSSSCWRVESIWC